METEPPRTVKIFYSYAYQDEDLRDELEQHVTLLKRTGQVITSWTPREIQPGTDWEHVSDLELNTADIILLLISQNFLNSDYCYDIEMQRALERHQAGAVRVIPIILRPVYWQRAPFGKMQALPTNGKPVTVWPDREEVWLDVVQALSRVVEELQQRKHA